LFSHEGWGKLQDAAIGEKRKGHVEVGGGHADRTQGGRSVWLVWCRPALQ